MRLLFVDCVDRRCKKSGYRKKHPSECDVKEDEKSSSSNSSDDAEKSSGSNSADRSDSSDNSR